MRMPPCSTAICAEPSTWPAGWKVTETPSSAIGLAEVRRLRRAGEILAVAQRHDVERLAGRQHRAVAGARMVGMAVRDQRAGDRPDRVDEEIAGRAVEALRPGMEQVAGAHGRQDRHFARRGKAAADASADRR